MSEYNSRATRGENMTKARGQTKETDSDIMFSILGRHLKPTDGKW